MNMRKGETWESFDRLMEDRKQKEERKKDRERKLLKHRVGRLNKKAV